MEKREDPETLDKTPHRKSIVKEHRNNRSVRVSFLRIGLINEYTQTVRPTRNTKENNVHDSNPAKKKYRTSRNTVTDYQPLEQTFELNKQRHAGETVLDKHLKITLNMPVRQPITARTWTQNGQEKTRGTSIPSLAHEVLDTPKTYRL